MLPPRSAHRFRHRCRTFYLLIVPTVTARAGATATYTRAQVVSPRKGQSKEGFPQKLYSQGEICLEQFCRPDIVSAVHDLSSALQENAVSRGSVRESMGRQRVEKHARRNRARMRRASLSRVDAMRGLGDKHGNSLRRKIALCQHIKLSPSCAAPYAM